MKDERHAPLIFEISWEVCSQVGGIYTVLRSRAPAAVNLWQDAYWLIGPWREESARVEFEAQPPPEPMAAVLRELRGYGVVVHSGQWLVSGRPQVLLIDLRSVRPRLGEIRYFLWKDFGIQTLDNDHETNDMIGFGHAVADLLMSANRHHRDCAMLAHFHEWQAAVAIPFLSRRQASFATVFTTHATLVGRSLSAASVELYERLDTINPAAVAAEHGITPRYLIEKAAANLADVFTTVSEITALEAERFLGRATDVVLPNGLNVQRFAAPHEFQVLHQQSKERIHEFVTGHFFPSYTFDLDRTLYVFTAGRYEYRNKGIDMFIEALYALNRRLKIEPNGTTLVAFIIAPAPHHAPNVETLNRRAMYDELNRTCAAIREEMRKRLVHAVTHGRLPDIHDLLDEYAVLRLKRMVHAWHRDATPTIVTHDLLDDSGDPILRHLRHRNLLNHPGDPVKVVFHPEFLTFTSPLLGLEYDQFVRGCNMGVFSSYYEPWGYTPLDCVVRGVPSITSDLSGFGAYLAQRFPNHERSGMFVAPRRGVDFVTTVSKIVEWLYDFTCMTRRQRIQQRNRVESYAAHFDWKRLIRHYGEAWHKAFAKRYPNQEIAGLSRLRRRS